MRIAKLLNDLLEKLSDLFCSIITAGVPMYN